MVNLPTSRCVIANFVAIEAHLIVVDVACASLLHLKSDVQAARTHAFNYIRGEDIAAGNAVARSLIFLDLKCGADGEAWRGRDVKSLRLHVPIVSIPEYGIGGGCRPDHPTAKHLNRLRVRECYGAGDFAPPVCRPEDCSLIQRGHAA